MSTTAVVVVNLRMALEVRYWTFITHICTLERERERERREQREREREREVAREQ